MRTVQIKSSAIPELKNLLVLKKCIYEYKVVSLTKKYTTLLYVNFNKRNIVMKTKIDRWETSELTGVLLRTIQNVLLIPEVLLLKLIELPDLPIAINEEAEGILVKLQNGNLTWQEIKGFGSLLYEARYSGI
jgi:hypothetical protein